MLEWLQTLIRRRRRRLRRGVRRPGQHNLIGTGTPWLVSPRGWKLHDPDTEPRAESTTAAESEPKL